MSQVFKMSFAAAAVLALAACATMDADDAMDKGMEKAMDTAMDATMPFGGPDDTAYAGALWSALQGARLVGAGAVQTKAYPGQHPHGAVLQNVDSVVTVNGETNAVIVKSNFGGEGVSVESVSANPEQYLAAVTVMFKRPGYDPDNSDWFWAKYLPDGSLDKNPKGMQLAGRVAKVDPPAGCIACHKAAPGGDMVFTHDRFAK